LLIKIDKFIILKFEKHGNERRDFQFSAKQRKCAGAKYKKTTYGKHSRQFTGDA